MKYRTLFPRLAIFLACLLPAACSRATSADENPGRASIAGAADAGWADAIRLDNGIVELVAAPGIARVVHFSLKGKPNVLRLDGGLIGQIQDPAMDATGKYKDFGGAKLWVAPQAQWKTRWGNWPPRYGLDSAPAAWSAGRTAASPCTANLTARREWPSHARSRCGDPPWRSRSS